MRELTTPRIRTARKISLKVAAAAAVAVTAGLAVAPHASAAGAPTAGTPQANRALADKMIKSEAQFTCFSHIVGHESSWNHHATNAASGAYGLVQALPANKMASAGGDWKTNPATQIKWGLDYMNDRYGSPCDAWSFWQTHHWY